MSYRVVARKGSSVERGGTLVAELCHKLATKEMI